MSFYLRKFYNSIKDPSWPNVNNYLDYVRLPKHIKQEAEKLHQGIKRLSQIEDTDYCTDLITHGYQYKNLVFVPIPKCASTYYTDLFDTQLGWKKVEHLSSLQEDTVLFSAIIEPETRWLKGLTEWAYLCNASDNLIETMFSKSILFAPDFHAASYSVLLGKYAEKINWFPIDMLSDTDVKKSMMAFFQQHGHDIELPLNDKKIHESTPEKLKLFEKIKKHHYQRSAEEPNYIFLLQAFYASDLKLYRRVAEKFISN